MLHIFTISKYNKLYEQYKFLTTDVTSRIRIAYVGIAETRILSDKSDFSENLHLIVFHPPYQKDITFYIKH